MATDQELMEIDRKIEEIHAALIKTNRNLEGLPFRSESETLRIAMNELRIQLQRMEENLKRLQRGVPEAEQSNTNTEG